MARMPGAVWKPMPGSSTTRMAAYDVLCFHTCVGSLAGTDSWFRQLQDGTNSHFGVGGDGTIWQWVDTDYRSGASYNGNYHLISVESADMGAPFGPWAGSDVPAFTDAQIAALGRIAKWVHDTHGIPLVQIPDSKAGRRGVGYHRLGVPGYMLPGTEQWSTKTGKVCPGDRRISQVPQVIAAANGGTSGGFLMALTDAQQAQLAADAQAAIDQLMGPGWRKGDGGWPTQRWAGDQENLTVVDLLRRIDRQLNSVLDLANRPMAAATGDNEFGHLLSLRAEVAALSAKVGSGTSGGSVSGPVQLTAADRAAIVGDVVAAIKELHLS